jgi:phosphonate transport system substrate-binding protein
LRVARPWLPLQAALAALVLACDATPFRVVEVDIAPGPNPAAPDTARGPKRTLRFSVAAIESPRDTFAAYSRLFERLGNRLGMEIEFVQRRTYREVNDLLAAGRLDAALVCTGGYMDLRRRAPGAAELLAVPIVGGENTYESLVIVPAASPVTHVAELEGKRFAFTDELSFTGRAYVHRFLADLGKDPERFFGTVTYTHAHDRSITAVAHRLVDGASVHSRVFANMLARDPQLARRVRVIHRSPRFGSEPIVVSTRLAPEERQRLRRVLVDLPRDPEGAAALAVLGMDGFAEPPPDLYDSAARVVDGSR